jgi:hypothetical protein
VPFVEYVKNLVNFQGTFREFSEHSLLASVLCGECEEFSAAWRFETFQNERAVFGYLVLLGCARFLQFCEHSVNIL